MKRITEIEILGDIHQVKYRKLKHHGYYKYGEIAIKADDSPRSQMRTLIHEYAHGLYEATRDPEGNATEEDFARLFELGIYDLAKNEWEVIERLKGEVE